MENFLGQAAGVVGQAVVVQEAISRTVSSVLGKREAKASLGDYMEMYALCPRDNGEGADRRGVSLLRDRIELERGYVEAKGVLNKHEKQQAHQEDQQQQEITQAITTRQLWKEAENTLFAFGL